MGPRLNCCIAEKKCNHICVIAQKNETITYKETRDCARPCPLADVNMHLRDMLAKMLQPLTHTRAHTHTHTHQHHPPTATFRTQTNTPSTPHLHTDRQIREQYNESFGYQSVVINGQLFFSPRRWMQFQPARRFWRAES
jgi:hypothetical protein